MGEKLTGGGHEERIDPSPGLGLAAFVLKRPVLSILVIVLGVPSVVLSSVRLIMFVLGETVSVKDIMAAAGQFGDQFGLLNASISLFTVVLIYRTYLIQQAQHKESIEVAKQQSQDEAARHKEQLAAVEAQAEQERSAHLVQERERHFFKLLDLYLEEWNRHLPDYGILGPGSPLSEKLKNAVGYCQTMAQKAGRFERGYAPFSAYASTFASEMTKVHELSSDNLRGVFQKFCVVYDYLDLYASKEVIDQHSGYNFYFRILFSYVEERALRLFLIHYIVDAASKLDPEKAIKGAELMLYRYRRIVDGIVIEREPELARQMGIDPFPKTVGKATI